MDPRASENALHHLMAMKCRHMKARNATVLAVVGLFVLMDSNVGSSVPNVSSPTEVRAQRFVLATAEGKELAFFGTVDGQPQLSPKISEVG